MPSDDVISAFGQELPRSCVELLNAAQLQPCYFVLEEEFPRIRFGEETFYDATLADTGPCCRCFTTKGLCHVAKCEYEQCPKCGLQISSCGCWFTNEKIVELHDPQEDDPIMGPLIDQAEEEADRELVNHKLRGDMGYCFVVWKTMKRILWKRHGIDWKSPADMNPTTFYD